MTASNRGGGLDNSDNCRMIILLQVHIAAICFQRISRIIWKQQQIFHFFFLPSAELGYNKLRRIMGINKKKKGDFMCDNFY